MGNWAFIVNLLFPIPLVFLLALCLPLPNSFTHKVTMRIMDLTLFVKIAGKVSIYQLAMIVSSILFVLSSMDAASAMRKQTEAKDHPAMLEKLICVRWRYERNFWISFFSVVLWLILYRVHSITKDLELYKRAYDDTQRKDD